jgi:dienelactone hydrolase
MVLVHGGGGSAFIYWVKLWNSRGYAAIAMDTCGCLPGSDKGGGVKRPRHEFGGPPGWGGFEQIDEPVEDQWTYHAAADVILAHSLIRSFPEVDPQRIGITGISWGGYLTCITSGVDSRFKFAAPVYGCGYLGENSVWLPQFEKLGKEKADKWLKLWDPSVYLKNAKMPMLWVDGTNDFAYPLDSLQKSYRLPQGERTLAIGVRMPHGHDGAGENPKDIHVFAESLFSAGKRLPKIGEQGHDGDRAWTKFETDVPIEKVELNYTKDSGKWQSRKWETAAAKIEDGKKASATIPEGTTVYYFNVIDSSGAFASTEHLELGGK